MKAEAYVTINWNGPYSNGEAAVAIVMLAEGNPNRFLKIYGFSHLSHQHAERWQHTGLLNPSNPERILR